MASETVEQVCEAFGELCEGVHVNSCGYIEDMTQTDACNFINDILAAHKRELAAKDEEIEERRKENEELQQKYLNSQWKIGVMERKINAKDAVIARLKRDNFDLNGCLLAEQESVAKRNALIKEFVELLNKLIPDECYRVCEKDPCDHIAVLEDIKTNGGEPCPCVLLSALIAKARRVGEMSMSKQEFWYRWNKDASGDGITFDECANCYVQWGLGEKPRCKKMSDVINAVVRAAREGAK